MRSHVQDQIDEYLAERLSPKQRPRLEQHVRGCRLCRTALQEAQAARAYLQWLAPCEPSPQPGPAFYHRVQEAIASQQVFGWFRNWAAVLHPRLAYPLAGLILLLIAWTLTYPRQNREEGLWAIEFPSSEFVQLSFSNADRSGGRDLVMRSLVEVPEAGFLNAMAQLD
ncbi:MAG: zf-HC2 domain-containing protein [Acidobacteria bacterium]|nr:zf-HC2 domain-containing protein [Acidobacteriota bacterium]